MNTLFDYPDPLEPGDTPLDTYTDTELGELIKSWSKDLTSGSE